MYKQLMKGLTLLRHLGEVTECRTAEESAPSLTLPHLRTHYSVRDLRWRGTAETLVPKTYTMVGS